MTNTHLTPQQMDQYRAGKLASLDDLLGAEAHLRACDVCRARLQVMISGAGASLYALLHTAERPLPCPDRAMLSRYAEGQADAVDQELVAAHLEGCVSCIAALAVAREVVSHPARRQSAVPSAPVSDRQRRAGMQRLFAPRILAPALAASALLSCLSLKVAYSVQQENRALARELSRKQNQSITMSARQGGNNDPLLPSNPTRPEQSTADKTHSEGELAEAHKQLQAEQARNAQTLQRLKQAQARLQHTEALLSRRLPAASRKHNNAAVVKSSDPHSAPPDTHQGKTSSQAEDTNRNVWFDKSTEKLLASVRIPQEQQDLLAVEEKPVMRGANDNTGADDDLKPVQIVSPPSPVTIAPRPWLRWKAVEGAVVYKVKLVEAVHFNDIGVIGQKNLDWFKEARTITDLQDLQCRLDHDLEPGKVYRLEVSAYADSAAQKSLARSFTKFLVANKEMARAMRQLAASQLAIGRQYEQSYQWKQAANQYRAIDPAVAEMFAQAQQRLDALDKLQQTQP